MRTHGTHCSHMYLGLVVVALWAVCTALWYLLPYAAADVYDLLIVQSLYCPLARVLPALVQ